MTFISYLVILLSCAWTIFAEASEEKYLASKQTYLYYPGSNRIAITYTWDQEKIVMREAFAYTSAGAIGVVSTDDGSDPDINNLKDVTFRKILYMMPSTLYPLGIPERIEEKVLDIQSGKEILVKAYKHYFSPEGRLIKQETYDANNQLANSREWEYDNSGKMVRQVNTNGDEIIWGYNEKGNRILEKGPKKDSIKEIFYDAVGRIIQEDELHEGKRLSTYYRYDTQGRKISQTDHYGNEINYIYDLAGNLTQLIEPFVEDENGKQVRPITMYSYNTHQQRTQAIDPKGNITEYFYANTTSNVPSRIVYPDHSEESFEYNEYGDLCKKIKNGYATFIERDFKGRVTNLKHYSPSGKLLWSSCAEYNTFFLLSETDQFGVTTKYSYDALGRNIEQVRGEQRTIYEHDGRGRIIKEIRSANGEEPITITFSYDNSDRIIEEKQEDHLSNVLKRKNTTYNEDGVPTQIITYGEEGKEITQIKYDSFGMTTAIDPYGNATIEKSFYDCKNAFGQTVPRKETVNASGVKTIVIQDALKRDKEIITKDSAGKTLHKKELGYDILGNLARVKEIIHLNNGRTKELVTCYEYDVMHRCIAKIEGANTRQPKRTNYKYNELGKIVGVEKPSGIKLVYSYTAEGLLSGCFSSNNSVFYSLCYDSNQRLCSVSDAEGKQPHTFTFDCAGQLVEEILPNGLAVQFEYDIKGNKIRNTFPDGSEVRYEYSRDLLRKITRLNSCGETSYTHTYDKYTPSGLPLSETLLDRAGTLTKSYDKLGKLKFVESSHYAEAVPNNGWNPLRQIIKTFVRHGKEQKDTIFAYNPLGKVIQEKGDLEHTYIYQSSGDLVVKDKAYYIYNDLNQLIKVGNKTLTYDNDGNLISDGQTLYSYDAWGRLIGVKRAKYEAIYTYDIFNRRLTKRVKSFNDNQTCSYLYDGDKEIACYCNKEPQEVAIFGADQVVALELKGKAYVPIFGCLGNIGALLNHSGHLAEGYRYSVFGDEKVFDHNGKEKPAINPWKFSWQRFDKESGLYYSQGQYYSPDLGIHLNKASDIHLSSTKIAPGMKASAFGGISP